MGSVVRPRGRKPAAVYWRRRIVLLAVVVGLVTVGWRWADGDEQAAEEQPAAASTSEPAEAENTPAAKPPAGQQPAKKKSAKKEPSTKREAPPKPKQRVTTTLEAPRGDCDAADVVVVPDVADAETRGPIPVRLGLSTTGDQACTFEVTAQNLALEVTSGDDMIWRAGVCPEVLDPQTVTLRPGWLSYVEATWSGRRASDDCLASNEFAEPGYYWAEAAIVGGEPARGQFRLEEPPPPPKKPAGNDDEANDGNRDEDRARGDNNDSDNRAEQDSGEGSEPQT